MVKKRTAEGIVDSYSIKKDRKEGISVKANPLQNEGDSQMELSQPNLLFIHLIW